MAVLVGDKLIINYGYRWNFFAPTGETLFMKSERNISALTYRSHKQNTQRE